MQMGPRGFRGPCGCVETRCAYRRPFAGIGSAVLERPLRCLDYLRHKNLPSAAMLGLTKSEPHYLPVRVSTEQPLKVPALSSSPHPARFFVERHALTSCAGVDPRRAP